MLAWAFSKFGIWDRIFLRIFEFSKIFWTVISKSTSKKLFLKIDLPETLWKLCLCTKFLHQEIGWNFDILCSVNFFMDFQKPIYLSFFSSHQSFHIFHFYIAFAKSVYPTSAFSILPPSNTTNIWQPHKQLLSCYSLHLTWYCRNTLIVLPLQQAFHTTTQSPPTFSWQYLPSTPSCLFFPDPADHIL